MIEGPEMEDYGAGVFMISALFVVIGGLVMAGGWFIGLVLFTSPGDNALWIAATLLLTIATLLLLCTLYRMFRFCRKQRRRYVFSDGAIT